MKLKMMVSVLCLGLSGQIAASTQEQKENETQYTTIGDAIESSLCYGAGALAGFFAYDISREGLEKGNCYRDFTLSDEQYNQLMWDDASGYFYIRFGFVLTKKMLHTIAMFWAVNKLHTLSKKEANKRLKNFLSGLQLGLVVGISDQVYAICQTMFKGASCILLADGINHPYSQASAKGLVHVDQNI